jgi:hypothetical protein
MNEKTHSISAKDSKSTCVYCMHAAHVLMATELQRCVHAADGVPPVLQTRGLPAGMEGLPGSPASGYRYVLFHFLFVTVTRRSLSLAIAASCLTFVALQVLLAFAPLSGTSPATLLACQALEAQL